MCLILDVNMLGLFLNPKNQDMKPVRTWMDKTGKIAYSPTEKMKNEFEHYINKSLFVAYREQGKMKFINKNLVEQEIQKLPALRSDDPHIIALALVAKVQVAGLTG